MNTQSIIFLLLSLIPIGVNAQFNTTRFFTKKDGLPSTELHSIEIGLGNKIWIANNGALANFDGHKFKKFDHLSEKLDFKNVFRVLERKDGVFLITESKYLKAYFMTGDSIRKIEAPKTTKEQCFAFDKKRKKLLLLNGSEILVYDKSKDKFQPFPIPLTLPENVYFYRLYSTSTFEDLKFIAFDSTSKKRYDFVLTDRELVNIGDGYRNVHNTFYLGQNNWIYTNKKGDWFQSRDSKNWKKLEIPVANEINNFNNSCLNKDGLLVSGQLDRFTSEIVEFNECYPKGIRYVFKNSNSINDEEKDEDGNFWLSTRAGLIKVFPAFNDFLPSLDPGMISDLHSINEDKNGHFWFGSYTQNLVEFDGKSFKPFDTDYVFQFMPGKVKTKEGNMLFCTYKSNIKNKKRVNPNHGIWEFDGEKFSEFILNKIWVYFLHQTPKGKLGAGLQNKGLAIREDPDCRGDSCWQFIGPEKGFKLGNVLTTLEDKFGRWWMGRPSTGIAVYEKDTVYNFLINEENGGLGALASVEDYNGNIWFGTNKGLYVFKNKKEIDFDTFSVANNFIKIGEDIFKDISVNALNILQDSILVVGNSEGFGLLDLKGIYERGKYRIQFFDNQNGYTGDYCEQDGTFIDSKENLWLISDQGAHRFDLDFFEWENDVAEITIDSLTANGSTYPNPKEITLKSSDKNVKIHYSVNYSLKNSDQVNINYILQKDDIKRSPTQDGVIELNNLASDTYELELISETAGIKAEPQFITFKIPVPLWKNPLFWLILLSIIGLTILYVRKRQEQQRLKENKLRVQAITSQLNPHFINNSLNYVQLKVYKNKEASEVVEKLSQNIGMVFESSKNSKAFHSLKEEMILVENYLNIQQKRFGDRFNHQIQSMEDLSEMYDLQVMIMMFQIHFENAIEHGIGNITEDRKGLITFKFKEENDFIHFVLEDDGVGRKKAAELESSGTQQGTKMLKDLLAIYNQKNTIPMTITYDDDIFEKENGTKYGTRVNFKIPKNYQYEL